MEGFRKEFESHISQEGDGNDGGVLEESRSTVTLAELRNRYLDLISQARDASDMGLLEVANDAYAQAEEVMQQIQLNKLEDEAA